MEVRGLGPTLVPVFCGVILEYLAARPAGMPRTYADVFNMAQHPESDPPAATGISADDQPASGSAPGGLVPEPAFERSRFSEWLASFGLGELQNPLLTRARPPLPRRPRA